MPERLDDRIPLGLKGVDESSDELVAVPEVDVEGLAGKRGSLHDRADRHLVGGSLGEERLGGAEDLLLGLVGSPSPAPGGLAFSSHDYRLPPCRTSVTLMPPWH